MDVAQARRLGAYRIRQEGSCSEACGVGVAGEGSGEWVRGVETLDRGLFFTFIWGSSRKFGLRYLSLLQRRLRIEERVSVGGSDDAPDPDRAPEKVNLALTDFGQPVDPA